MAKPRVRERLRDLRHSLIPTVLSFDVATEKYVIGEDARVMGIRGKTNAFGFKKLIGSSTTEYEKGQRYWLAPTGASDQHTKLLSAKVVATEFLRCLLQEIVEPAKLVFGIPATEDQTWLGHYKGHLKDIMKDLGRPPPDFLYEPFAIYQYYRHKYPANGQETVLILDVGGSTFNSLIVRTTQEGYLPRSGLGSTPLGVQADFCGGSAIDKLLLEKLVAKAKTAGYQWKDDPFGRAISPEGASILPVIEDSKIELSRKIPFSATLRRSYPHFETQLAFPAGTLHATEDINVVLTGDDLKDAVDTLWTGKWKDILFETIRKAEERLVLSGQKLDTIDRAFVAGGSSRLPFFREELLRCLKQYLTDDKIIISDDPGYAVAEGIALEVRERSRRTPELKSHTLGQCILSELYVGFRESRTHPWQTVSVCAGEKSNTRGQLIAPPIECKEGILEFEIELPFKPGQRFFYGFFLEGPERVERTPVNVTDDVVAVPRDAHATKKIKLRLQISGDSEARATFSLLGRGQGGRKARFEVPAPPFFIETLEVAKGDVFVGIDFGHTNSYVTSLLEIESVTPDFAFPQFEYNKSVRRRLAELEEKLTVLRDKNILTDEAILRQAQRQCLNAVFHSNKIEGIGLTIGETQQAISSGRDNVSTKEQMVAVNLQEAYKWVLENARVHHIQPHAFIRNINLMLLRGVNEKGGEYRGSQVEISGLDWKPPPPTSVPSLMDSIAEEMRIGPRNRSALEFSATIHTKLVTIHPFVDGNGRTARLLLNAILISYRSPAIVVRWDDRPRYLDALSKSNEGQIGSLIGLFADLCEGELRELVESEQKGIEVVEVSASRVGPVSLVPKLNPEGAAELAAQIDLDHFEDPLAEVLRLKREIELTQRVRRYGSWASCWQNFLTIVKDFAHEVGRAPQYANGNLAVVVQEWAVLSFESFCDFIDGRQIKETWFCGLEVKSGRQSEGFMFLFDKTSLTTAVVGRQNEETPIALFVARRLADDGYRRLTAEPISLRFLLLEDGRIRGYGSEGACLGDDVGKIINRFIAEVVCAYLLPEMTGLVCVPQ